MVALWCWYPTVINQQPALRQALISQIQEKNQQLSYNNSQ